MTRFKDGDRVYIPGNINNVRRDVTGSYDVYEVEYVDVGTHVKYASIVDESGLLLTADEIAGLLKTKADAMAVTADSLQKENEELKDKCAEFLKTIGVQSDKLRELQAKIAQLTEVNSSLGENRDALNNEAAVHMTSIHNLQVAVEVLAEKIFEMRCEQDG